MICLAFWKYTAGKNGDGYINNLKVYSVGGGVGWGGKKKRKTGPGYC